MNSDISTTKNGHLSASVFVVEATGFEPATSASRTGPRSNS